MEVVLMRTDPATSSPPAPPGRSGAAGFSLVEVLIAALVLLIVVLGVVPLFARSIVNNVMGHDHSTAVNFARSELEFFYRLPFNSPELTVPEGQTELVTVACWEPSAVDETTEGEWIEIGDDGCPAGTTWRRTTVVRQYSAAQLEFHPNNPPGAGGPFPGGTDPSQLHLKEIEIFLESLKTGGLFGPPQRFDLRVFKPS